MTYVQPAIYVFQRMSEITAIPKDLRLVHFFKASLGIVIGLSAGSAAIRTFHMTHTLVMGIVVSLGAIGLLLPVTSPQPTRQAET